MEAVKYVKDFILTILTVFLSVFFLCYIRILLNVNILYLLVIEALYDVLNNFNNDYSLCLFITLMCNILLVVVFNIYFVVVITVTFSVIYFIIFDMCLWDVRAFETNFVHVYTTLFDMWTDFSLSFLIFYYMQQLFSLLGRILYRNLLMTKFLNFLILV